VVRFAAGEADHHRRLENCLAENGDRSAPWGSNEVIIKWRAAVAASDAKVAAEVSDVPDRGAAVESRRIMRIVVAAVAIWIADRFRRATPAAQVLKPLRPEGSVAGTDCVEAEFE
jgi:hypothetical protein